jgi:hypothetical protein
MSPQAFGNRASAAPSAAAVSITSTISFYALFPSGVAKNCLRENGHELG